MPCKPELRCGIGFGSLPCKPELQRGTGLAVCLANQNCGARPRRGRAALSKWFSPANRQAEGRPTGPSGHLPTAVGRLLERRGMQYRFNLIRPAAKRRLTFPKGEGLISIARRSPSAFPSGGPNAPENVQWTFSSEDGPVRPMGGAPAGGGRGPRSFPAFPFGGPNARENVQWTFSSEDGPVRPMEGGSAKPRRKRSSSTENETTVKYTSSGLPRRPDGLLAMTSSDSVSSRVIARSEVTWQSVPPKAFPFGAMSSP